MSKILRFRHRQPRYIEINEEGKKRINDREKEREKIYNEEKKILYVTNGKFVRMKMRKW